ELKFLVDIEKGQKTGFFIDQRENRKLIGSLSRNKKVLNAFGFTGGFSIYALSGGASEVVTVDISKEACLQAIENASLNNFGTKKHKAIAVDCFDYLREMDLDFDLIILDPPAFAKNAHSVDKATKGYKDINLQAFKKSKPDGLIASFSCSQHIDRELFRKILMGAAQDSGRFVQILHSFDQPLDHPIAIGHPEGEYLKGFLMRVS
ncbi:MAG TPA: class I SAM-dependent methyltransferase, partial [Catalimonadaceae bacterium]|nr:class I SAM-dependent methyltransferase [Catalimonadaceae bacterium]